MDTNLPLDKSQLEEHDLVDARECLTHLSFDLTSVEPVEAELQSKSSRELRAMIVADLLDKKFERHLRYAPPGDVGAVNAYERWAGHLGLGEVPD